MPSSTNTVNSSSWIEMEGDKVIIDRAAFIAALTVCAIITLVSAVVAVGFIYRGWSRRRLIEQAKAWGRKSRYEQRLSTIRREIDNQYSRQYSGCLHQEPENPYVARDSPPEGLREMPTLPS